jgi:DNA polymerase-3 subunit epsilon
MRRLAARNPIFLDTETTGLHETAEVVEVSAVNLRGEVLIDTLVSPVFDLPEEATRIHGITRQMVEKAPGMRSVWAAQLRNLLAGNAVRYSQPIVIYNADFDYRLIKQSLRMVGITVPFMREPVCLMRAYAEYHGDWDDAHYDWKWQKLGVAIEQCGIETDGQAHRALADADACRRLFIWLSTRQYHIQVSEAV